MLNKILSKTIKLASEKIIRPIILKLQAFDIKMYDHYCSYNDAVSDDDNYNSYLTDIKNKQKKSLYNIENKKGAFWKSATYNKENFNKYCQLSSLKKDLLKKARHQNKINLRDRINQVKSLLDSELVDIPTPQIDEDK